MDYEKHRATMLAHCIKLAGVDKRYAWWAAKRYARESEGVLHDLPHLLTTAMKEKADADDCEGHAQRAGELVALVLDR